MFFILVFFLLSGEAWAKDCSGFLQDLKSGQALSPKDYQKEAEGLYIPPALCAPATMSMVSESAGRTEVQFVEQCRKIGYLTLRTSVVCLADAAGQARAQIHVSCEMGKQNFSPCITKNLELPRSVL